MPWSRDLGGSRVQMELADELSSLGCQVKKFDLNDAFPWLCRMSRVSRRFALVCGLLVPSFASRARTHVRNHASQFDIIDCHQGNLPYSKDDLRFHGLLVARSVGLHWFYAEFAKEETRRFPPPHSPRSIAAGVRRLVAWRGRHADVLYTRSLQMADLINLPNEDELRYVSEVLGLGHKCMVQPFGLSQARITSFLQAAGTAHSRFAEQEVVFIGAWSPRKGSRDWAEIVARVKQAVPGARFKFLGTGVSADAVLADLRQVPCDWINIVSTYASEELPSLLANCTVGAFPSYIEGFGFGVLEMLAAGLPTVAYDVPGPRAMLRSAGYEGMVEAGDVKNFAQAVTNLLSTEVNQYLKSAGFASIRASEFSWSSIARETLEFYRIHARKLQAAPGS